jgi:hypothetical protein
MDNCNYRYQRHDIHVLEYHIYRANYPHAGEASNCSNSLIARAYEDDEGEFGHQA